MDENDQKLVIYNLTTDAFVFEMPTATSGRSAGCYDTETLPSPSGVRALAGTLPSHEVGCVTTATVTSAGSRLILPDVGVSLMIPEGALKTGQIQDHYLAVLREDRYRPFISGNYNK